MLRLIVSRPNSVAGGVAVVALLAAGCAGAPEPYAMAVAPYGAEQLHSNDYVVEQQPGAGNVSTASALASMPQSQSMTYAFQGVDGARRAHRLYGEAKAEQLDGSCETSAKIANDETLYDIADYCDTTVETLLAANPQLGGNPRAVYDGMTLNVPAGFSGFGNTAWAGIAYSLYVVQPGDSVAAVAASHRISPATLIEFNPQLTGDMLPVGAELRVPAVSSGQPVASPTSRPYAAPLEYSLERYEVSPEVEAVMPYRLTPAQEAAQGQVNAPPLLTVDRRSVEPGENVTVSAVGLPPNSDVSIYRGPNGRQLEYVKTVRTDGEGRISEPVRVKRSSNPGGVIFKATVDGTGKDYQSPRVGVNRIGEEDADVEEDLDADLQ